MKKFLLTAALSIAATLSASAEVDASIHGKYATRGNQATELTSGNWYMLYNQGRQAYVNQESDGLLMRAYAANQADYIAGMLFKVTKEGDNYYLMSGNGKYFSIAWGSSTLSETPVAYTIAKITDENANAFYIQNKANNSIADGNNINSTFVGYGTSAPTAAGSNNDYRFYSVNFSSTPTRAWNQSIISHYAHTLNTEFGLVTDASKYTCNKKQSNEGTYLALLDDNYDTYFHSSWSSASQDKTDGIKHYLQADLSEKEAGNFRIYFKKRSQNNNDRPIDLTIQGSTDGENFTDITTINSGMPTDANDIEYMSPVINGGQYTHLRFVVNTTSSTASDPDYRIFFTFSEFYILPDNEYVDLAAELINDINGANRLPVDELQTKGWAYEGAYEQNKLPIQVTFNVKYGDRILETHKYWGLIGDEYSISAPHFFADEPFTGTYTSGETNVDVILEHLQLPFAWTETTENMKWQGVRQHPNYTRWWTYIAIDDQTTTVQPGNLNKINDNINGFADEELWAFVGNYFDGFKIYNKAAGTDNWLYKNGDCAVVGSGSENNIWHVYPSADFPNEEVYCCFKTGNSTFLNAQGNNLKFWSYADGGSSVMFYSLAEPTLNYYNSNYAIFETLPYGTVGSYANFAAVKDAKDAAVAAPYDTDKATALIAAINGLQSAETIPFDADKAYRLVNATYTGEYMVIGNDAKFYGGETNQLTNHNSIFRFEPKGGDDERYYISSQGRYVGHATESNHIDHVAADGERGEFVITSHGAAKFSLVDAASSDTRHNSIHHAYHSSGYNWIVGWENSANASTWYLTPVESIEIALTEATLEDKHIGLGCFPFPVEAANGCTLHRVYAGTDNSTNDNVLTYSKNPIQIIPAGEAFLVMADNTSATLNIKSASTAMLLEADDDNVLSGTYRASSANEGDYVLTTTDSGELAFVKQATAPAINVNSAYVDAAKLPESVRNVESFAINNPDNTTSISEITASERSEAIYDLQGRRLAAPAKGVNIIGGRKVLVK